MSERIDDLFASFARDLKPSKAEQTIAVYRQSVMNFVDWLAAKDRPVTVDSLTKHAISAWLGDLTEQGLSENTVLTRFRSMRRFVRWLAAEGEIPANPMANLEQPPTPDVPVPIISDEEIAALLKTCDGRTFDGRRDEALIRVLFDCGPRISELAGITMADLDMDMEVLRVVGKGKRVRVLPFGAKTARAIDRFLRLRKKHRYADSDGLWLGQRGPISDEGIRYMLGQRAKKAGVKDLHAHRFRHTFAHDWLVAGGQERDLKRLAGWKSDVMLERYGASAAVERAHAAARRLKRGDRL